MHNKLIMNERTDKGTNKQTNKRTNEISKFPLACNKPDGLKIKVDRGKGEEEEGGEKKEESKKRGQKL